MIRPTRIRPALLGFLFSFLILLMVSTLGLPARAKDPANADQSKIVLSGDWKYLPFEGAENLDELAFSDRDWPSMPLPSNWFLQGKKEYPVAADLSPAPTGAVGNWGQIGQAPPDCGLDYAGHIWFRRHFQYQAPPAGQRVILRFEMVDYFADVYINGQMVGRHEGYFQPFEFDVTRAIQAGDNLIAVRVGAQTLIFDWLENYPISWPKRQDFIKGIFSYHDTRPGGTTVRGQERSTGGIIGDISLRNSPGVDIIRAEVAPTEVSDQAATLRIDYVLRNWTDTEQRGSLKGEIMPKNFSSQQSDSFTQAFVAKPGLNRVTVTRRIDHPALWWSWDYGKPNLYQLTSRVVDRGPNHQTTFGIRSITHDDKWVWRLNGQRIFPRGSNYISTQWLSQADRAWYERDVKLMIGANLNSMRVHAHVEKPDFYDLADEMGLMIWQDFPLQWGYTDEPAFQQEAIRQLDDMIGLHYNHPSIIAWCMHNESPHAMAWMVRRVKDQNLALDNALVAEGRRLDPVRVNHRDSGTGDNHAYPGWYEGKARDFAKIPGTPFLNEYGAEALPNLETMKTMFPADALWPDTPAKWEQWAYHNFQRQQTFLTAKIPMGNNLEEFIRNSQNYQGALLRFSTEHYRRAKWDKTTGIYQFMFVEDWPSITWAVVDYYRRPKHGYESLRDAMQPVLPSIEYMIDDPSQPLALWVVNDHLQAYPGAELKWRLGGEEKTAKVDVPADGVVKVAALGPATAIGTGQTKLEVWLTDKNGVELGHNTLEAGDFLAWKQ